jgi:hypothetical protein
MLPKIRIEQSDAEATIAVDGVELNGVTRISVEMAPNNLQLVTIDIASHDGVIDLSGATLQVGGIDAPEALERAMLEHLRAKYESLVV